MYLKIANHTRLKCLVFSLGFVNHCKYSETYVGFVFFKHIEFISLVIVFRLYPTVCKNRNRRISNSTVVTLSENTYKFIFLFSGSGFWVIGTPKLVLGVVIEHFFGLFTNERIVYLLNAF